MRTLPALAVAAAVVGVTALPAQAAVTFDPATGRGFVGKGDVQIAFGWNNTQLQRNASGLTFSSSQPAEQAMTQSVSQGATQSATQGVTREVSCTIAGNRRTFYNEGYRLGEREGTRTGSREGSRTGSLSGSLTSSIAYDTRVRNQITGFNLTGYATSPSFASTVFPVWGAIVWNGDGEFHFSGDYDYGDVTWSGWQSEPGENPADCLGGNPGVTDLVDETSYGTPVEGDVEEGTIVSQSAVPGAVTATGAAVVLATHNNNTVALP